MSVNIIFYPPNAPAFVRDYELTKTVAQDVLREESGMIGLNRVGWEYEIVEVIS